MNVTTQVFVPKAAVLPALSTHNGRSHFSRAAVHRKKTQGELAAMTTPLSIKPRMAKTIAITRAWRDMPAYFIL